MFSISCLILHWYVFQYAKKLLVHVPFPVPEKLIDDEREQVSKETVVFRR